MDDEVEFIIPKYTAEEITKKAEQALEGYNSTLPINIDLIVEKKFGLDLFPQNGLKKLSGTDAFLSGNLKEIDYDPDVFDPRIRFSIAHELGHFVLHGESIKQLKINSFKSWKIILGNIPDWIWRAAESQADEFAGKLLVPRDLLVQSVSNYKKELNLVKDFVGKNLNSVRSYLSIPLAKLFDVSQDVIKIRLMNEEIDPFEYI